MVRATFFRWTPARHESPAPAIGLEDRAEDVIRLCLPLADDCRPADLQDVGLSQHVVHHRGCVVAGIPPSARSRQSRMQRRPAICSSRGDDPACRVRRAPGAGGGTSSAGAVTAPAAQGHRRPDRSERRVDVAYDYRQRARRRTKSLAMKPSRAASASKHRTMATDASCSPPVRMALGKQHLHRALRRRRSPGLSSSWRMAVRFAPPGNDLCLRETSDCRITSAARPTMLSISSARHGKPSRTGAGRRRSRATRRDRPALRQADSAVGPSVLAVDHT